MRVIRWLSLVAYVGLAGCGGQAVSTEPPSGWQAADGKWWTASADTTGMFRNLETFAAMGIEQEDVVLGAGRMSREQQLINMVQGQLIRLVRNQPEVVDSLFQRYAVPKIKKAAEEDGDPDEQVDRLLKESYRTIARHFREPRTQATIGEDMAFPERPDSLSHIGGTVRMQIYLNAEGQAQGIEVVESVHPVLDAMAMRATAEMTWSPAYLHGEPIPSWTLLRISYNEAEGE